MLSMKSESLNFIFKNSFGFDTLTVNGCFEEVQKGGFVKATKTLAIELYVLPRQKSKIIISKKIIKCYSL